MDTEAEKVIPITEWPIESSCSHTDSHKESTENTSLSLSSKRKRKLESNDDKVDVPSEESSLEAMVQIRVARWWRRNKQFLIHHQKPNSTNPNTILQWVSRTEECQKFLQEEAKALTSKIHMPKCVYANIYAALAGVEDWLGQKESGLLHITHAVEMEPDNPDYLWLKEKLTRDEAIVRVHLNMLNTLKKENYTFPRPLEVDRVSTKDLSKENFISNYVKKGKPVIIIDLVSSMTSSQWNLDLIKSMAGKKKVVLKKSVHLSAEWACLEDSITSTVEEFIDLIKAGQTTDYLFDWSLPIHCPELADTLTIPKYFAENYLQQTSPGTLYHDSWPSLFIAPSGAVSQLHVDAFASSFWMALFEGEKRWTFFPPDDLPLLYPTYPHSMDPVFKVNLQNPDLESFPLLSLTHPSQCVLKPGELLYVPSGSPHFVENLVTSLAISSNHVDALNYERVCQELHVNGLIDPRAKDLLTQLKADRFTCE